MHAYAEDLGMSFVIKSLHSTDFFEGVLPIFPDIAAPFINRENLLDRYICKIRDCIMWFGTDEKRSYTVDEYGNPTDEQLCIQRRKINIRQKVYVDVKHLFRWFKQNLSYLQTMRDNDIPFVTAEELFKFEYTGVVENSLSLWESLL
eukprot:UN29232